MEPPKTEQMHLELVQTTSVLNKLINLNCTFDGSNIIYLAGSSIVYHNVFQNNKRFTSRATPYPPIALAFHKAAETSIAITSKINGRTFIEFYLPEKAPVTVELYYDIKVYDSILLDKKKVCLLCTEIATNSHMILIVNSNRKLSKIDLDKPFTKFAIGDHRILAVSPQQGSLVFSQEDELLEDSQYSNLSIKDVLTIDDVEIIVTTDNLMHVFFEGKQIQQLNIKQYYNGQWMCGIKVARSILVAFKGQLVLGHFQWTEGKLQWAGYYQYPQRIRANIVCMQNSADEMNVALGVQIYHKDTWIMEFFLFNCGVLSSEKKFVNAFTRIVPNGTQYGEAVSMQRIISSEVFLLSGPSIVNYCYMDHIEKKHKYVIHESPRLIAVHPLGYQILCTFEGVVKFYQKVQQELIEIWSETWSCFSARYTEAGLLLVCIWQQGSHQIVLYDPNSFKRMKNYNNIYLKHSVSCIEFDQNETEMILWSGHDLSVYRFKNGEKLSEFRQKKEGIECSCVQYDSVRHVVLAGLTGNKKGIIVCKKNQAYHLNFSSQKHFLLDEDITCILIKENINTVFMGTQDGKILFGAYPFSLLTSENSDQPTIAIKSMKVHSCPTSDLLLTNNNKYLFVASKTEGLAILKIKKNGGFGGYACFDISNYNFIQSSSKPYLENVQDKLKALLQKRKTIFNELDEYKKQWDCRRQREAKSLALNQKKMELTSINGALTDISKMRAEHDNLLAQLKSLQFREQDQMANAEQTHNEELLTCYSQNDRLKQQRDDIEKRCLKEYSQIQEDCSANLKEIQNELKTKFQQFQQNYNAMMQNLKCFSLRAEIQAKEEQMLAEQEIEDTRTKLRSEEQQLYRRNNQLKGEITRNKKQLERYLNRRDFLQNKQRFFTEELRYCKLQQAELGTIKQQLQNELRELETDTFKKEKRLRKYFLENQMLLKYQIVHDNLTKTTERELSFQEKAHATLKHQISQLQKEIISISDSKTELHKDLSSKQKQNETAKNVVKGLKSKRQYLQLQIKELERLLSRARADEGELTDLYERFFLGKHLEGAIECQGRSNKEKQLNREVERKIRQQLQSHKDYLVKNMTKFQKINAKTFEELQLNHIKYQSQNYALISQCNVRKQQINKKKRILQQMVNSVRQTQNYMAQLQNNPHHGKGPRSTHQPEQSAQSNQKKQPRLIPFLEYEQQQQKIIKKEKSESFLYKNKNAGGQVRKMLDVQRLGSPQSRILPARRIQTACIKKGAIADPGVEVGNEIAEEDCGGWLITKPQTACKRRGAQQEARRLFSRNKSRSKPTTCTSHSKHSVFI